MKRNQQRIMTAAALAAALALGGLRTSRADLVAYWDMNTGNTNSGSVLPGNLTPAEYVGTTAPTLTFSGSFTGGSSPTGFLLFTGSTNNAVSGDIAGAALAIQNGTTTTGQTTINNGSYLQFDVNTANYQNLVLTYSTQGTSTGFSSQQWSYSTDGGTTWITVGSAIKPPSSFATQTVDLSSISALANDPNAELRVTFSGSGSSQSGNNRIDNVQLNATSISGLTWNTTSGNWDINTTPNWTVTAGSTDYQQGNSVAFTTPSADSTVTVAAAGVSPSTVYFGHTSKTYTLAGGAITVASTFNKVGAGSLTVNNTVTAANAFLSGGTLAGTGSILTASSTGLVTIGAGTTLSPGPAAAGTAGKLTFGNLSLNSDTVTFDVGTSSSDLISAANLTVSGTTIFNLNDLNPGALTAGHYPLIAYTGAFTGATTNFALNVSKLDNLYAFVVNNTGGPANSIDLVLSSEPQHNSYTWTGGGGSGNTWLTAGNWDLGSVPGAYDIAVFNTAGTSATVGINLGSTTNNGTNNQAISQISLTGGISRIINNSSGTVDGTLTLNAANGVLLSNSSTNLTLTLQNGTTNKMNVALAASGNVEVTNTGATIEIDSNISGAGGITKTGLGTLILTGANNYSGGTVVSAGKLLASGTLAGATTVNANATLGVSVGAIPATLNLSNLTLQAGSILAFNLDTTAASDKIVVSGPLVSNGAATVNVNALPNFSSGTYDLISFTGTAPTLSAFSLGTIPAGFSAHFSITSSDVDLIVSGGPDLTFLGNSTTWNQSTINWNTQDTTPLQVAWNDDGIHNAVFNGTDSLPAPGAITVAGTRTVNLLKFSNKVYTLSGGAINLNSGLNASESATLNSDINLVNSQNWSIAAAKTVTIGGNFSGNAYLTLTGPGTLDLSHALSAAYGGLVVSAGTVLVNDPSQLGFDPSVVLNGGAVQLATGFVDDASHGFTIGTAGGVVNLAASVTITFDQDSLDIAGAGVFTKDGPGTIVFGSSFTTGTTQAYTGTTVYINAGTIAITATNPVNASHLGSANINVNVNKLSGTLTPGSGGTLQLGDVGVNVQLGSTTVGSIGYIDLYDGATFIAGGKSSITHIVTAGHASSLAAVRGADAAHLNNVTITTLPGAVLTLNDLVGQFSTSTPTDYTGSSNAVIHLTGSGTVVLAPAAPLATANDTFAGAWSLESGTLEIVPVTAATIDALDALGFQAGDPGTAATASITVAGGTFELATNTDHLGALSSLPGAVVLNGGAIAGTTSTLGASGARFGGALTVQGAASRVLLYDPASPASPENIVFLGSANTNWQGLLTVDPGAATGGKLVIASTGAATVGSAAQISILANATVELQGAASLYDTLAGRGVAVNVAATAKLNATSGASRLGAVTGSGPVSVSGAGTTLTVDSFTGNALTLATGGTAVLSIKASPTSAVSELASLNISGASQLDVTDNPLIIQGSSLSAVNSLLAAGEIVSSLLTAPATLTAVTGTQFHNILGGAATLAGATVANSDVLVLWKADVNMDGIVDLPDLLLLDTAYLTGGPASTSLPVDLNGDGKLDYHDYAILYSSLADEGSVSLASAVYADGVARFGPAFQSAVPEPATLGLLGLAAAGLLLRRRR